MHDGPGLRVEHRSAVLFVVVVGLRVGHKQRFNGDQALLLKNLEVVQRDMADFHVFLMNRGVPEKFGQAFAQPHRQAPKIQVHDGMRVFVINDLIRIVALDVCPDNNEMLLFSRRVDSRGMDAALHFPITRQQCFKRVFILHGENSQRLAKVHAQFRERPMKDLPELLELVGDFPGFFLAGIADDGKIRGVHFDPSVFRSCGSVPTPNSQECK